MLETLFSQFDSLLVLDTETTGINCRTDEIIELVYSAKIESTDIRND